VLGSVLSGYTAVQLRSVGGEEPLAYRMQLQQELRATDRGHSEFDICVSATTSSGEEVWRDVSTFTVTGQRRKPAEGSAAAAPGNRPEAEELRWVETASWQLGPQVGRQFGALNGDVNPIHMAAWCARLFGFRSNIAHGMLVLARAVVTAEALPTCGAGTKYPRAVQARFRRPMLLPAKLRCVTAAASPQAVQGGPPFAQALQLAVRDEGGRDCVTGCLQWGSATAARL